MNRLVLIDGNAVLHRAYHALPPLRAPDGSVINALYGFASMLLKVTQDLKPTHVAVAFDRPKPTFRKELYKGYQAARPKMEEDLSSQIPKVYEMLTAFHIPMFGVDGFEADDVIGTIATTVTQKKSKLKMDEVIIMTGDRDILQLVADKNIQVFMPTKGLSEGKLYGEKEVKERMGVEPDRIPDFKAFAGDASDNYPGVAGIGPKTAINLIDTFGSVEDVYKALRNNTKDIQAFSAGTIEKLKKGAEDAALYKNIATIRRDVPVPSLSFSPFVSLDTPDSRKLMTAYDFQTLYKRVTGEAIGAVKKEPKPKAKKKSDAGEQLSLV